MARNEERVSVSKVKDKKRAKEKKVRTNIGRLIDFDPVSDLDPVSTESNRTESLMGL